MADQAAPAHRPTGNTLTYEQAATLTGKHLATIYRWVKHGHVRPLLGQDPTGQSWWGVAELDILAMKEKRWTRRPRPAANRLDIRRERPLN